MKKIIAGLSALALAGTMSITAFAVSGNPDTTNIVPAGGSPFDSTPTPGQANTLVQFGVDPAYTVTIPAKVELTAGVGGIYSGSGALSASGVRLKEKEEITVSITSASECNLKTSSEAEYKFPYTAEGDFGKITDKKNGGVVAKFTTSTEVQNTTVSFTTDEVPQYAGRYTDPVIFTIAMNGGSDIKTFVVMNQNKEIDGTLEVPAKAGKKWSEIGTEIATGDLESTIYTMNTDRSSQTRTYETNAFYYNTDSTAGGVWYYTGDQLYLIGVAGGTYVEKASADDVVSDSADYRAAQFAEPS